MKVVIIGGVAGGANVATRLRRISEDVEVVMFEKGPYVSFANCGLPYHIGKEIQSRSKLLMATPESLKARYNIDVRIHSEVTKIDPQKKFVIVQDVLTGNTYQESFDHLVISTGASPIKPPIEGIDAAGVFTLRDMGDMDSIIQWIDTKNPQHATVVGGGFIGLEVSEQLHRIGLKVTIVEGSPQLLAPLDPEMAQFIHKEVQDKDVKLVLADPLSAIKTEGASLKSIVTKYGKVIETDLVIMGVGVRPNVSLAKDANVLLGQSGAIAVNEFMQTNVSDIWALGDAVESTHQVLGIKMPIPLAVPANRQGRIVADNIIFGLKEKFTGGLGTAIARVFDLTAASTGANEKQLQKSELEYKAVFIHPNSHAGYYPGATSIALKLLFNPKTGQLLGAQAVGKEGIDKRIDVIATAIKGKLTVHDLIDLELSYAPPFGSAKDPVNIAGMAAQNVISGLVQVEHPLSFDSDHFQGIILDVRDADEISHGMIPHAVHIPLGELRNRLNELAKTKPIVVYCQSGMRSYLACRILSQNGFTCSNLSGAFKSWSTAHYDEQKI
jgi:NADPH-dependent 2,4-dienoyl-CoA reductase/sulfur reductase-like enzyme/rhodanese-related sulfurtransferase